MKQSRREASSDSDYGVPIPGRILPPDQWARTAIKRLPPPGPLDFAALFGRTAPVVLDLGCGNGRFTITSALGRPKMDHLAVDILPLVIRYATRRANQRGLANVRFSVIGGYELLEEYIAPGSVAEIHVYHPQPHSDASEHYRRLVTPEFLALVQRSLIPAGLFVVQTDNAGYWHYIRRVAPHFFEFEEVVGPWPDAREGRTRREIYARRQGLPIFRGTGRPRPQLPRERIGEIIRTFPAPDLAPRGASRGR